MTVIFQSYVVICQKLKISEIDDPNSFFYFEKLNYGLSYFPELPHPTLGARGEATSVINLKKYLSFYLSVAKDLTTRWKKHCDMIIPYIRVSLLLFKEKKSPP